MSRYILAILKRLKHVFCRPDRLSRRPYRRPALFLEALEPRYAPEAAPLFLQGNSIPFDALANTPLNMRYDNAGNPEVNTLGFLDTLYQQPGTDGKVQGALKNLNIPDQVNGSTQFDQAPKSSDWWTNLMFRLDPDLTKSDGNTAAWANQPFVSEPSVLKFVNEVVREPQPGDTFPPVPYRQGLGIFNPETFLVSPGNQGGQTDTLRSFEFPAITPLTLGIGGLTRDQEITPVGQPGVAPDSTHQFLRNGILNVRVNHYSDWGVQVVYGDGNNPDPTKYDPLQSKNSLTVDMVQGNPFTYFTKKGPTDGTAAPAKLWLVGNSAPGQPEQTVNVWNVGLDPNVLGVTMTNYSQDGFGVWQKNVSSYLVIAPDGSRWDLNQAETTLTGIPLYTNAVANGLIVVASLPHFVGDHPLESLPDADKRAVADLFIKASRHVPTQVDSHRADGSGLATYATSPQNNFDPATGAVRTTFTVNTADQQAPYQVLFPSQYDNLVTQDQGKFLKYRLVGTESQGEAADLQFSYQTLRGRAVVFDTNAFTTELQYQGILPYFPSVAFQTSAATAQNLFESASQWMTWYLANPTKVINYVMDNYAVGVGTMQLSQQLQLLDRLSESTTLISDADKAQALVWRDRLLEDLEYHLFSFFDLSTGRVTQLYQTYGTLIFYPTGFGADTNFNDHHFHAGYFLNAFATVAQFDPAFVRNLLPVIDLLVRDIAGYQRNDPLNFPYTREFNPFAGISWANGTAQNGGQDEESASESISFAAGLTQLGMLLNKPEWVAAGAYQYTTEIESLNQYWFNANADPAAGDYGNWPKEFVDYTLNGTPNEVTQIARVSQLAIKRDLFFAANNPADAIYAINWFPPTPAMLFLGANQRYLQRDYLQYVKDYNLIGAGHLGPYQPSVATIQALLPDSGFGFDQPGPTNALMRLDPALNPAMAPVEQGPPGTGDVIPGGYGGISQTISLQWIYSLQALGQVDHSVIANTLSYSVFIKDGLRTFVAFNPTADEIEVVFKDKDSGVELARLRVGPGQTVTRTGDGRLYQDRANVPSLAGRGTNLYLANNNLLTGGTNDPAKGSYLQGALTLSAGTAGPVVGPATNSLDLNTLRQTYGNLYVQVPRNKLDPPKPGEGGGSSEFQDAAHSASFTITGLTGTYDGGQTQIDVFLNLALTWADALLNPSLNDPTYGRKFGPGVVQNKNFDGTHAIVEISYDFNGTGQFDRVEKFDTLLQPFNQFVLVDSTATANETRAITDSQTNLAPFRDLLNGAVRVRIYAGPYGGLNSHKDFAISVNTAAEMARSSRVEIPYNLTSTPAPVSVVSVSPVAPNPRNAPVGSVTVALSAPTNGLSGALRLTRNGQDVALTNITITNTGTTYTVGNLAALQSGDGNYVLTVDGGKLSPAGTGVRSVSWVIDTAGPTLTFYSDVPPSTAAAPIPITALFSETVTNFTASSLTVANGTLTNFTGAGALFFFDVVPAGSGPVSVTLAANTARDAAGNANAAATTFTRTFTATAPTVVFSLPPADQGPVTNKTSFTVNVKFSAPISGFALSQLQVTNGTASGLTGSGDTYSFTLTPAAPGLVAVVLPENSVGGNAASAVFRRGFDPTTLQGKMVSFFNPQTFYSPIQVLVEFNKPVVTELTAAMIATGNATASNVVRVRPNAFRFDLTPLQPGVVTANIAGGQLFDAAGNANSALPQFTPSVIRTFRAVPSASITTTSSSPTSDNPITFKVVFNEDVVDFAANKLDITGGQLVAGSFTKVSGSVYTLQVTPAISPVEVGLVLHANEVHDPFGLVVPPTRFSVVYENRPTATIKNLAATLNGAVEFQVEFSQPVDGLDFSKIQVTNGTVVFNSGIGGVYNFFLVPTANGPGSVQVLANAAVASRGTGNAASAAVAFTFNNPSNLATAVMTSTMPPHVSPTTESIPVRVVFNKAVTSFDIGRLSVSPNTKPTNFKKVSDTEYTFDLVPTSSSGYGLNATINVNMVGTSEYLPANGLNRFTPLQANSPLVSKVTSLTKDGTYGVGTPIILQVTFDRPVQMRLANNIQPPPFLVLATGASPATAPYLSGSGTKTLNFLYIVRPGDTATRLDYTSVLGLALNSNFITDAANQSLNATLDLPQPGQPGSLSKTANLVIDTTPDVATVTGVSATTADGVYSAGQINLTVQFSGPVTVTGQPQLRLNAGPTAVATYASGSGTSTLVFTYTVGPDDFAGVLNYASVTALELAGNSTIMSGSSPANLLLPDPDGAGSLAHNKILVVAAARPKVAAVITPLGPALNWGVGQVIPVQVVFSQPVVVAGGNPQLKLNLNGTPVLVDYVSGSGSNTLTFNYTVAAGQFSQALDYADTSSLILPAGVTIKSALTGQDAVLALAPPGQSGSLSAYKTVTVLGSLPHVVSVEANAVSAAFGDGSVITIFVVFDRALRLVGTGNPTLTLSNGAVAEIVRDANPQFFLKFLYKVKGTDASTSRLDYASTTALDLKGSKLVDLVTVNNGTPTPGVPNELTAVTLPAPGTPGSLSANNLIAVQTTAVTPIVVNVGSPVPDGSYTIGQVVPVTVTFSQPELVTGSPQLALNNGGVAVYNAVTGLSNTSGQPGSYVTIFGQNLLGATAVRFNGVNAPNFTVLSATAIKVQVPLDAGSGPIQVDTRAGTYASLDRFTITAPIGTLGAPSPIAITSFTPSGTVGSTIQIIGTNLFSTSLVQIGSGSTTNFSVNEFGTVVTVVVPANATSGTVALTTLAGVINSGTKNFAFQAPVAPTVATMSVAQGQVGTFVKLTGANFLAATVTIGGVAVEHLTVDPSGTSLTFNVPAGAATGPFTVTNPAGSVTSPAFAVTAPVNRDGTAWAIFFPNGGDSGVPGTLVTIAETPQTPPELRGSLLGASEVRLSSGAKAPVLSVSPDGTSLTFLLPAGLQPGPVTMDVQLPGFVGHLPTFYVLNGTPSATLTFLYTVAAGQTTSRLDYASADALTGGTITSQVVVKPTPENGNRSAVDFNPADRKLPAPGGVGSLAVNKQIAIDGSVFPAPTVTGVTTDAPDGRAFEGNRFRFLVTFSHAVFVQGTPLLEMNVRLSDGTLARAVAEYVRGSGTNVLQFEYVVGNEESSARLDFDSVTALDLNGGTIHDAQGHAANLSLAVPGRPGSLSFLSRFLVGTPTDAGAQVQASVPVGQTTTNAATVQFTVTFTDPVSGLTAANFVATTAGGITGASVASVTSNGGASSTSWTVTVNTGTGDGTLALTMNSGAGLSPAVTGLPVTSDPFTIDKTAPTVSSLTRADSDPTAANSVRFLVTFSEPVIGVAAGNFSVVAAGGVSGAAITNVTGSGTRWTVTVNTGTGNGTLGLNLVNAGGVVDAAGNALTGLPVTGPTYTVQKSVNVTGIQLLDPPANNLAGVRFRVSFDDPVTGLSAANFTLNAAGVAGASIADVSGSGTTWTVTVNTGTGSGTVGITLANANGVTPTIAGLPVVSAAYTIDRAAPAVLAIDRVQASPTNAASVQYRVTLTRAVNGLTAANFALTGLGTSNAAITGVSGAGTDYLVTVDTGDGDGTLRLDLVSSDGAADAVGNLITGLPFAGQVYVINKTPPAVLGLAPVGANPTNAASVDYTVTFNEPVAGVSAGNFALALTGVTGASITGVSGSGTTWTVTADTGSGDGTLRLDMVNSTGVTDTAGQALTGLPFQGQTLTVDRTAPAVASIARVSPPLTNAATVDFTVTLSKPVTGLAAGNFALATTGVTGATITNVTGSGTTWTVTVGTGTGSGTLGLNLVNSTGVADSAGNLLSNLPFTGEVYTVDKTTPDVLAIDRLDPDPSGATTVDFRVVFSVPVTGVSAANFALVTAGLTGTSITAVTGSGTTWQVTANTGSGDGTLRLDMVNSDGVTDALGQAVTGLPVTGAAYQVVKSTPLVGDILATDPNPTSAATVQFFVFFNRAVTGVSPANFQLVQGGGLTGASITGITPASASSSTTWVVTVDTGTGSGTLGLNMVNSTNVSDGVNPVGGLPFVGEVYTVDKTTPAVVSVGRTDPSPTNQATVSWTVVFSKPVTGVAAGNFALQAAGVTGATITAVTGGGTTWTVVASTGTGTGLLSLDMVNSNGVADALGNPVGGLPFVGEIYDVDRTAPTVTGITRAGTSPTNAATVQFAVTFDKPVTGLSVGNFGVAASPGVGGGAVVNITGAGTTWTVTVFTGSGDGTLGLNMVNSDGVTDAAGNAVGSLPFTGEVYAIEKTGSSVLSITLGFASPTNLATVTWLVTFSDAVTGVSAANFALTAGGTITGAAITGVTGGGTAWVVTAGTGTGDGTLELDMVNSTGVLDSLNNPVVNVPFTGEVYVVDKTAPVVSAITLADPNPTAGAVVQFTVVFSKEVAGLTAGNFTLVPGGALTGAAITGVSGGGTTWTVTVNTGSGDGTLGLNLTDSTGLADLAGNPVAALPAVGPAYTVTKAAPVIVQQPRSGFILANGTAFLEVIATGTGTLRYQWYRGTSGDTADPIAGATGPQLTTDPLTADTSFWVRVTDEVDLFTDSTTATIFIVAAPRFLTQPASQTVVTGDTALLSVTFEATEPVTLQWYQGASGDTSNPVAGATAATFVTPPLTAGASFWVQLVDAVGQAVNSDAAVITVSPALAFLTQPLGDDLPLAGAATLSVSVTGGIAPYTYQWFEGPSGDTSNPVQGATDPVFHTPALTATTQFWVRVVDDAGSVIDSDAATLTVVQPPVITTQPQGATLSPGDQPTLTVAATGRNLTYQWYEGLSGDTTNPIAGATGTSFVVPPVLLTRSFWVQAVDDVGQVANSATATLAIPITVGPAALPALRVHGIFSQALTASGGHGGPFTFAVTAGSLPAGLALSADGQLTGTPTAAGDYTFTVTATDADGETGVVTYSGTVQLIRYFAVAADAGGGPDVWVYDTGTGRAVHHFFAFDPTFAGGVRIALGDVNADGVPDFIAGAGPGGGPQVRVFDGRTGEMLSAFFAYDMGFTGGVFVATGDVNNDGRDDIITGAGAGGGPQVRVFDGRTGELLTVFFAYDMGFAGGVHVAAGDVTGDGFAEVVTGAGAGGGPQVRVFDGRTGQMIPGPLGAFFAYDLDFTGGVYVTVGDVTADGRGDVITGPGAGGGPQVRVFDGRTGAMVAAFFAYDQSVTSGVRVAATDDRGQGLAVVLSGAGPLSSPHVKVFDGKTLTPSSGPSPKELDDFFTFDPLFGGGVFTGASR